MIEYASPRADTRSGEGRQGYGLLRAVPSRRSTSPPPSRKILKLRSSEAKYASYIVLYFINLGGSTKLS